jgi:hypothetical protein
VVSSGVAATYIVASEAAVAGKSVLGVGKCPDPSAPGGYGPEISSPPVKIPEFIELSGPARKINYSFEFTETPYLACNTGSQIFAGSPSSGSGLLVASADFVSYKWVYSSVPFECVCPPASGSSQTVQPGALVNRANGSQEFLPVGIAVPLGSGQCSEGFTNYSTTREWTFQVTGVLDSSNNPVAPA